MLRILTAIIILLLNSNLPAETGQRPDAESIIKGKILFQQYCQSCHGKNGIGEKPIPPPLKKSGYISAMPLNETSHAWHHSDG